MKNLKLADKRFAQPFAAHGSSGATPGEKQGVGSGIEPGYGLLQPLENGAQKQDRVRGGDNQCERHTLHVGRHYYQPPDNSCPTHHHPRVDNQRRDGPSMVGNQYLDPPRQASRETASVATKISTRLK